jgi:hypothetical protein
MSHTGRENGGDRSDAQTRCRELSWPLLNMLALEEAHSSVALGDAWCLFSYMNELSPEESTRQHAILTEGLGTTCSVCDLVPIQTMVAYYDVGEHRPRFEPWILASGNVHRDLAAWLCYRFRGAVAFWGRGTSLWALTPDEDRRRSPWGASSRLIGPFSPGAIAHAIRETPTWARFLGFDFPAPSLAEAMRRGSLIGDLGSAEWRQQAAP